MKLDVPHFSQKWRYGAEKNSISTAIILSDYNGGDDIGDNGDGRTLLFWVTGI